MRIDSRMAALTVVAAAAAVACGSATQQQRSESPQQVLLTAAHTASTTSLRLDAHVVETLTVTGTAAPQLGSLNGLQFSLQMHDDIANAQNMKATADIGLAGQTLATSIVVYQGQAFLSLDGGAGYRAVPESAVPSSQYGVQNGLQYLQAIANVTDDGPTTVDGVAVEQYHATLNPQKIVQLLQGRLSTLSGTLQQMLRAMQFGGGSINASVDQSGRLVTETGTVDCSVNLGLFKAALQGSSLHVAVSLDAHYYDYGAPITVTRPANVTGTVTP